MNVWQVSYLDGTKERFRADSYESMVGAFRNEGVSVAWVNVEAVRSVKLVPDTDKEDAIRSLRIPQG